jgi:hypothetical protein
LNGDGAEIAWKTKAVKGERVGNEVDGNGGCAVVEATVGANRNI